MADRDYVLGTDRGEIARLERQHAVWRPAAVAAWTRAGIGAGSTVIDVGSGPGFATRDLVALVGSTGRVHAVERSEGFVSALLDYVRAEAIANVSVQTADLSSEAIGVRQFDAAWCRWVACFVRSPERLVGAIADALKPGGVVVFHEYVDYASWRALPTASRLEPFVAEVMASWRAAGGEPDVARHLPRLLEHAGFAIFQLTPLVYALRPSDEMWKWPAGFIRTGAHRLRELGRVPADWVEAVTREIDALESDPNAVMITPMVLEIIARRQ